MGLKERIQADMQKAAKERNSLALSALRMALAAIKKKEIEERGEVGERGRLDPQGARHDGEATEGVDRPLPAGGQGGPRRERGGGDRRPGGGFAEGALGGRDRNPSTRGGGGSRGEVPGGRGPRHEGTDAEGGGTRRRKDRQRDRSAPACRVAGTGRRLFPGGSAPGIFFRPGRARAGRTLGGRISESTLREIRDRTDIVEGVSATVRLARGGGRFRGLCPFHRR